MLMESQQVLIKANQIKVYVKSVWEKTNFQAMKKVSGKKLILRQEKRTMIS